MQSHSRETKQRKLKNNMELNIARAIKGEEQDTRSTISESRKNELRQMFVESAERVEKKLPYVWNDEPTTGSDGPRSTFVYFGGVNFDENGKIIR